MSLASRARKPWHTLDRLRPWFALSSLLVSGVVLTVIFGQEYKVQDWLFWRYLRCWIWVAVFCTSSLSIGHLLVSYLFPPAERWPGHLTISFATGVYAFFLLMFLAGIGGLLGPITFFGVPLALIVISAPSSVPALLRLRLRQQASDWYGRLRPWEVGLFALGCVGLAVVFVATLVPENAAYDARWYHMPLAEHYVAQGAIRRFPEGALAGTVPHLASILYTWAFLAPGADLFDKVELCAQLEFAIFLFTLAGIPLLVRELLPGVRAQTAWVALFLFPSIFAYDSTLTIAADHIAALWAIPAFVVMLRALPDLDPRSMTLLAIQLAGLMMTKYTSVLAAAFPMLAVAVRALGLGYLRVRGRVSDLRWLWGLLSAVVSGVVLTAPHWLKNWLWYGDPVYPILNRYLTLRPWMPDARYIYEIYTRGNFEATGPWSTKLSGAARALYNHSYGLYTWESFHGRFAIFGSAFTFSLVALPFLKATRRLWAMVIAIHLGVVIWYVMFHEDRYLQVLLPWMAAAYVGIVALAFRQGLPARIGIVFVGLVQLVWGTEIIFWPSHQVIGKSGIGLASDFFAQTLAHHFTPRTKPFEDLAEIGRTLPEGSKLLLHNDHLRLGLGVATVTDAYRVQYGINYGYIGSSPALHRRLREYGVTHVAWNPERIYGDASLASDLVFHAYVTLHLRNRKQQGSYSVAELPEREPIDDGQSVFLFDCSGPYENGLFELSDLRMSPLPAPLGVKAPKPEAPREPLENDAAELLAKASLAVINSNCKGAPEAEGFKRVAQHGSTRYLVRGPAEP